MQVSVIEMSASKPSRSRVVNITMPSKSEATGTSEISLLDIWLLSRRRSGRRGGMNLTQAFKRNCRNQSFQCKGKSTSGHSHEAKVPMWSTGAERSVRAMKVL